MQTLTWNEHQSQVEWDEYRAFHVLVGDSWDRYRKPIAQFDTGEVIIRSHYLRPSRRKQYGAFNISLFQASDISYSRTDHRVWSHLYRLRTDLRDPDGNKVAFSQLLKGGAPLMLWDHDTNRIVTCGGLNKNTTVPVRFRDKARAYFAGAGSPPVGGQTRITTPAKLDKEEKTHIANVRAACKAWYELGEEGKQHEEKYYIVRRPLPSNEVLNVSDFLSLPLSSRIQLARYGCKTSDVDRLVDYLQVVNS